MHRINTGKGIVRCASHRVWRDIRQHATTAAGSATGKTDDTASLLLHDAAPAPSRALVTSVLRANEERAAAFAALAVDMPKGSKPVGVSVANSHVVDGKLQLSDSNDPVITAVLSGISSDVKRVGIWRSMARMLLIKPTATLSDIANPAPYMSVDYDSADALAAFDEQLAAKEMSKRIPSAAPAQAIESGDSSSDESVAAALKDSPSTVQLETQRSKTLQSLFATINADLHTATSTDSGNAAAKQLTSTTGIARPFVSAIADKLKQASERLQKAATNSQQSINLTHLDAKTTDAVINGIVSGQTLSLQHLQWLAGLTDVQTAEFLRALQARRRGVVSSFASSAGTPDAGKRATQLQQAAEALSKLSGEVIPFAAIHEAVKGVAPQQADDGSVLKQLQEDIVNASQHARDVVSSAARATKRAVTHAEPINAVVKAGSEDSVSLTNDSITVHVSSTVSSNSSDSATHFDASSALAPLASVLTAAEMSAIEILAFSGQHADTSANPADAVKRIITALHKRVASASSALSGVVETEPTAALEALASEVSKTLNLPVEAARSKVSAQLQALQRASSIGALEGLSLALLDALQVLEDVAESSNGGIAAVKHFARSQGINSQDLTLYAARKGIEFITRDLAAAVGVGDGSAGTLHVAVVRDPVTKKLRTSLTTAVRVGSDSEFYPAEARYKALPVAGGEHTLVLPVVSCLPESLTVTSMYGITGGPLTPHATRQKLESVNVNTLSSSVASLSASAEVIRLTGGAVPAMTTPLFSTQHGSTTSSSAVTPSSGDVDVLKAAGNPDAQAFEIAPHLAFARLPHSLLSASDDNTTLTIDEIIANAQRRAAARGERIRQSDIDAAERELRASRGAFAGPTSHAGGHTWREYEYAAAPNYREASAYSTVHFRVLEAMAARDLGAVWSLFTEHKRIEPQEGKPDFLLYELVVDACARAKRFDLVMNVLWPELNRLNMVVTPALYFTLVKGASLSGETDFAAALTQSALADGKPKVTRDYYLAVISGFLAESKWSDSYRWFNKMKRAGFAADASLYSLLFAKLSGAHKADATNSRYREDMHYVWVAMQRSPSLVIPKWLYTQIICALAAAGNVDDMLEAAARMNRRADAAGSPEPIALSAMFDALMKAGRTQEALDVAYQLKAQASVGVAASEIGGSKMEATAATTVILTGDAARQWLSTGAHTAAAVQTPLPSQVMHATCVVTEILRDDRSWDATNNAHASRTVLQPSTVEGDVEHAGSDGALDVTPGQSYKTYGSGNVVDGMKTTTKDILAAMESSQTAIPVSAMLGLSATVERGRLHESVDALFSRIDSAIAAYQQGGYTPQQMSSRHTPSAATISNSSSSSDEEGGGPYRHEMGADRELLLGVGDDDDDGTAASLTRNTRASSPRSAAGSARRAGNRANASSRGGVGAASGAVKAASGTTSDPSNKPQLA